MSSYASGATITSLLPATLKYTLSKGARRKHGGYTIHHLRRTFVSDAHDAGLAASVIMAHTGHVQEPTMLRYLGVRGRAQHRAQEQLEGYRREQAEQVRARARKVTRLVPQQAG